MKKVNQLALLLSLGALVPFAASAKTLEQAYLESARKGPGIPVPIAVVAPRIDSSEAGEVVEVEFVVDQTGHTSAFNVKSSPDEALAEAVVSAVKQWRFAPALRNGAPVTTKVVLPVRIVANGMGNSRYAVN